MGIFRMSRNTLERAVTGRASIWLLIMWSVLLVTAKQTPAQLVDSLTGDEEVEQEEEDEGFVKDGAWEFNNRTRIRRRFVELTPKEEAQPALSIRFIPHLADRKDGNAAIFYLQALAFAEQSIARRAKEAFDLEKGGLAESWRGEVHPDDLPLEDVHEYLSYTDFQRRFLREAVLRKACDFDRHIRDEEKPLLFLLPEIQALRELARLQALRFRVAIAESNLDEAIAIQGQMLGLANHLSSEPFLVSSLVGIACAGIAMNDHYFLAEESDCPNLYWAFATLPKPLVNMDESMAFERDFLYESFERLREVDETPRSDEFWQSCVSDLSDLAKDFEIEGDIPFVEQLGAKAAIQMAIAAAYPGAMKLLVKEAGYRIEDLNKLTKTHVFFLAMKKHYDLSRDEAFKCYYVPYPKRSDFQFEERLESDMAEYGVVTAASNMVLPALQAAGTAQARCEQYFAMAQTVEAIRDHLASHGQLPANLAELRLPAPADPATGTDFYYELRKRDKEAVLQGGAFTGIQYRLILRPTKS